MVGAYRRTFFLLFFSSAVTYIHAQQPLQMASLRPGRELVWQRTSPSAEKPDGPVLYQILFRSSATPGSIPKIANNFTLTNSLISESGNTIMIGGTASMSGFNLSSGAGAGKVLTSDASGNGTWQPVGSGGSVSITAGTGLTATPNPITGAGNIGIANGGVTPAMLSAGGSANGQVLTSNGSAVSFQNLPAPPATWLLGGNAGTGCTTSPCTDFIGTTDNTSFEVRVNGSRAFRIEPQISNGGLSPNVIAGFSGNHATGVGTAGATIAGGGLSGGSANTADFFATVGGGAGNTASGSYSIVAGGGGNTASGGSSSVAGGAANNAQGADSAVGGGNSNTASGFYSAVVGGGSNIASGKGSTVAGGFSNTASGYGSFIAAGLNNTTGNPASPGTAGLGAFAAGQYASADQNGCFVWGDNSTTTSTTCGAINRFVVRATGGAQFSNGVNVDTSGADGGGFSNNNGTNLLVFGGASGEAIGSQRASSPGTNQYGLDFYTNSANRMFIDLGGTVHVVGNLTKGGGSFQIDHPLDPDNKYLSHSFVESPDMMNIYNGNITTDARGNATVLLPDWFEALNRDFRYQLTVIGEFAQAIIAREVRHNRFTIRTNRPHVKVSWQVTGIRHDAYANAHRIQVEEDKGEKRGTYLHPELFKSSAVAAGGRP